MSLRITRLVRDTVYVGGDSVTAVPLYFFAHIQKKTMYAVSSLLRRVAASTIYVRLEQADGGVAIERVCDVLDLSTQKWGRQPTVPVFVLTAKAGSSEEAAILLAKKENGLYHAAGLESKYYTMLLGPESEETDGDTITRSSRLGVVRGIFRSSGALLPLTADSSKERRMVRVGRKLPPGVIFDER
jgi:hypothetical protein